MTIYKQYLVAAQKRREQAERLRKKGWTLEEIARDIGVSRQRVHQMLAAKRVA